MKLRRRTDKSVVIVGDFNPHLSTNVPEFSKVARGGINIQNQLYFYPLATNIKQHFKTKTIKLLDDNIGENRDGLGFGNDFLDTIPKRQSVREIIDKPDFTKI